MNSFDLERALAQWRRQYRYRGRFLREDLDELERHLRDHVTHLQKAGLSPQQAFNQASRALGEASGAAVEYRKVYWRKLKRHGQITPAIQHQITMLKNYLKVALRTIKRHPGYAFINIFGLAVGLTCCALIALYIQDELRFDRFHRQADHIYRVIAERGEGDDTHVSANTSYPIVPQMKADFPEIAAATRLRRTFQPIVQVGDEQFREERFFVVDSTFFDVFSFPLLIGDPRTVLDAPDAVVITEETARRYFGDEHPIGQTLTYQTGNTPVDFTVTGVLRNLPPNSHVHFDFLGRIDHLNGPFDRWQVFVQNYSFVLLPEQAQVASLQAKLASFVDRHVRAELEPGEVFNLFLQPLTDIHLYSDLQSEVAPNGSITFVYLFAAIAFFILLIACANFVNLATARAMQRAREVGVRKAVGAHRLQLVRQFLSESVLLSLLSLLVAALLLWVAVPLFNNLSDRTLHLTFMHGLVLTGFALAMGLLAGLYPAFHLSAFRPAITLKGGTASGRQGVRARQGLVVFQFVISIALLVCTGTVYQQMQYVRGKNLGFDKEHIVVVPIDGRTGARAEALTRALEEHPNVMHASASMLIPSTQLWTYNVRRADQQEYIGTGFYTVDHAFVETYDLHLRAGRAFDPAQANDSTNAFMVNEEVVRRLGYGSPEAILGERLDFGDGSRSGEVIGVLANFNVESLHEPIEPIVFFIDQDFYYLSVRVQAEDLASTLGFIQDRLATFAPHLPFDYSFVDERFDALHRADERLGQIFSVFAALAVFIACLGLFGLAAFTAQRRTKEVGVRKVLGATAPSIVALLSKNFLRLVAVAFVMACPLAYFAMRQWLNGFAYHIDLTPGLFLVAGGAALLIALLTVSYQAIKAALVDPVTSLRYE